MYSLSSVYGLSWTVSSEDRAIEYARQWSRFTGCGIVVWHGHSVCAVATAEGGLFRWDNDGMLIESLDLDDQEVILDGQAVDDDDVPL